MVTDPVIGIDLGTTNSVVAFTDDNGLTQAIACDENNSRVLPSAVYIPEEGDVTVGISAKNHALVEPDRVAQFFKRGMGEKTFRTDGKPFAVDGREWTPEMLSSRVLMKLKLAAETYFDADVSRAVITVPAYFGTPEVQATRNAGEMAGLQVLEVVKEPVAAAFAHTLDRDATGNALVYDLGGGTFDVTVMQLEPGGVCNVVAIGGDRRLGGVDFDDLIMMRMGDALEAGGVNLANVTPYDEQQNRRFAEEMKHELSSKTSATCLLIGGGQRVKFSLAREEFVGLLAPRMDEIADHITSTIQIARDKGVASIDNIIMIGGSTRIPALQEQLARVAGRQPKASQNPDEDVARGASLSAVKKVVEALDDVGRREMSETLLQLADKFKPQNVCSHGLGVKVVDLHSRQLVNHVVIASNTPIPFSETADLETVEDSQTHVEVVLNEGDSEELDLVRELGKSVGQFPHAVPKGHPIEITIQYTDEQLIVVKAYEKLSRRFLCDITVQHDTIMSEADTAAAIQYLSARNVQ